MSELLTKLDKIDRDLVMACAARDAMLAERCAAEIDQRDRTLNWSPPPLADAALWYARQGWPVFPLRPLDKRPYPGSHGFEDATCDDAQVEAWWKAAPDSNIGCATGRLFDAIDVDGPLGVRSVLDAWEHFSSLDVLAKSSTPRPGGTHVLVPATGRGNAGRMLPGVDYRGLGGYVVLPPSVLDSRNGQCPGVYRWARSPDARLRSSLPVAPGQGAR